MEIMLYITLGFLASQVAHVLITRRVTQEYAKKTIGKVRTEQTFYNDGTQTIKHYVDGKIRFVEDVESGNTAFNQRDAGF